MRWRVALIALAGSGRVGFAPRADAGAPDPGPALDDVHLYNRALSSAEIAMLAAR